MGDKKMVERMRQTTKKQLDRGRLHDVYAQRLQHYVEAKLDAMAQQKDIAGRSKMSKAQLIEALSRQ